MRAPALMLLAVLSGCGAADTFIAKPPGSEDAVLGDAGLEPDAGPTVEDAGIDAGQPGDAGHETPDAGGLDAGQPDAGPADAGAYWPDPGTMTSAARLYTSDGTAFTIDQVRAALTHALAGASTRHVIFYVHGRACGGGGEPTKSLGEAVPELQTDYSARVLMFTWPGSSNGCPLGFPESDARASGPALGHTIHKLAASLSTTAEPGLTMTFISHSLGNIVLEEALASATRPWPPSLFATAVLNSSATAASGHATWLAPLSFAEEVYVSVNSGDSVLTAAGIGRSTRLGKSIDGVPLTARARYVDFSAADVNHAYYLHGGQKGAGMRAFYDAVMRGQPWSPASASGFLTRTDVRNGASIYVFNGR